MVCSPLKYACLDWGSVLLHPAASSSTSHRDISDGAYRRRGSPCIPILQGHGSCAYTPNASDVPKLIIWLKHFRVPLVRCAFVGPMCSGMHIVAVHAQLGCTNFVRPIDLAIRPYVTLMLSTNHFVINLDEISIMVDQYPTNSPVDSPFSYTIYQSNDVCLASFQFS